MKSNTLLLMISAITMALSSCTNLTLLGHVVAYDVNAEFKADPIVPIGMNAGFESRSFVAVPPKNSVNWKDNFQAHQEGTKKSYILPKGDVLPTISRLRIQGVASTAAIDGVAFDFVSSGATGKAAIAAAGGTILDTSAQSTSPTGSTEAKKLAAEITNISTSPDSIPKP